MALNEDGIKPSVASLWEALSSDIWIRLLVGSCFLLVVLAAICIVCITMSYIQSNSRSAEREAEQSAAAYYNARAIRTPNVVDLRASQQRFSSIIGDSSDRAEHGGKKDRTEMEAKMDMLYRVNRRLQPNIPMLSVITPSASIDRTSLKINNDDTKLPKWQSEEPPGVENNVHSRVVAV